MDAPEEVVLDENLEAEGLEYYSAQFLCFNPSQTHIAWLEDRDGGERFVLRVRELATGKEDSHSVTDLKWSLAWGDDETCFTSEVIMHSAPVPFGSAPFSLLLRPIYWCGQIRMSVFSWV